MQCALYHIQYVFKFVWLAFAFAFLLMFFVGVGMFGFRMKMNLTILFLTHTKNVLRSSPCIQSVLKQTHAHTDTSRKIILHILHLNNSWKLICHTAIKVNTYISAERDPPSFLFYSTFFFFSALISSVLFEWTDGCIANIFEFCMIIWYYNILKMPKRRYGMHNTEEMEPHL